MIVSGVFLRDNSYYCGFLAVYVLYIGYTLCWRTAMSISSTRKVSSSTAPARRTERSYAVGGQGEAFVENIDTTNNVSINNDSNEHHNESEQSFQRPNKKEEKSNISSAPAYVASAIEALAASGVYEQAEEDSEANTSHKIGVYDNNQSIIKEDQQERNSHPYLKHFYEKNEIVEEVDELV